MQKLSVTRFGLALTHSRRPVRRWVPQMESLETRDVPASLTLPVGSGALQSAVVVAAPTSPILPSPNQGPTIDTASIGSAWVTNTVNNINVSGVVWSVTVTGHATPGASITLTDTPVDPGTGILGSVNTQTTTADKTTGVYSVTFTVALGGTYSLEVTDGASHLTTPWAMTIGSAGQTVSFESTAGRGTYSPNHPGTSSPSDQNPIPFQPPLPSSNQGPTIDTASIGSAWVTNTVNNINVSGVVWSVTVTGHATPGASITLTDTPVDPGTGILGSVNTQTTTADKTTGVYSVTFTVALGGTYSLEVTDGASHLTTPWAMTIGSAGQTVSFESTAGRGTYSPNHPGTSSPSGHNPSTPMPSPIPSVSTPPGPVQSLTSHMASLNTLQPQTAIDLGVPLVDLTFGPGFMILKN